MIYILQGITAEKKLKTQVITKTKDNNFEIETEGVEESVDYDENDEDKKHSERINYFLSLFLSIDNFYIQRRFTGEISQKLYTF